MAPLPPRSFPSPDTLYPVILPDGTLHKGTVFLNAAITNPNMQVGDYTYASAHVPPQDWAFHLAPYLLPQSPEMLRIGKFCQIADGVTFITSSANHRYDGFSSFPFAVFLDMDRKRPSMPDAGPDTTIGDDVWIGQGATILPGADIGSGCIIGAKSVVLGRIPPYTIVAGNPAKPVRRRFDDATCAQLLEIAWWDWPIDVIVQNEAAICGGDLKVLLHAQRTDL
ncbi:CatB-related O-acetyltransferase [Octadecabacter sp. 1_MG-2023]|uniref:CatB-related O-acetyltransferase n=1 Tax=unclassified Octadecabacter TaxID=196158 RepID=UPI001C080AD5|nr:MULTISPECIES: CatB-related O-acetyltransferase [unclassified Octadecabacter]MBU2992073.1 CatB-related O-acetyltransferase [Octadecabacter sp. B2R22]MDO6736218.1 CatB-related O-acetyltransferase [Octadecabacter sp. 1_MG-2023]